MGGLHCNLEKILGERGMKQKFFADKLNMRRNTISAIIHGTKTDIETALRIANVLGLKVEDIWNLEEEGKILDT
jgi:plasmid maintenance system antidote protein VapI